MQKLLAIFISSFAFTSFVFSQSGDNNENKLTRDIPLDPTAITSDFMTWYQYHATNVHLSGEYIPLNYDSSVMDKTVFLNKMIQGEAIAFNTKILNGIPVYRLYKIKQGQEDIRSTIKSLSFMAMMNLSMEGKLMPAYDLMDIDGKKFNNASAKGKLTVLKCWFIHCAPCVREMPELNKLVEKYKNNKSIQFIGLALDDKPHLQDFLQTTTFKYAIVPDMQDYINKNLKVMGYPTHFLIDGNGMIIKVVNQVEDLLPAVDAAVAKMGH